MNVKPKTAASDVHVDECANSGGGRHGQDSSCAHSLPTSEDECFRCTVCGDVGTPSLHSHVRGLDGASYALVRCPDCSAVLVWPPPSDAFLSLYYMRGYDGRVKRGISCTGDFLAANQAVVEDGTTKLRHIAVYWVSPSL